MKKDPLRFFDLDTVHPNHSLFLFPDDRAYHLIRETPDGPVKKVQLIKRGMPVAEFAVNMENITCR